MKPRIDPYWQTVLAILLILLVFGIAGRLDCEDALAQQNLYCEMVKGGEWPDYAGTYKEMCLKPATDH